MQPERRDAARLWDMLGAADDLSVFIRGRTLGEYQQDPLLKAAVERKIEIIGEAARGLSRAFQEAHPGVPWRLIIAQRHVLAHDYGDIIDEKIWRVATLHVPALAAQLRPLLPSPPHDPEPDLPRPAPP